jgi:hypothetical protein
VRVGSVEFIKLAHPEKGLMLVEYSSELSPKVDILLLNAAVDINVANAMRFSSTSISLGVRILII